MPDTVQQHLAQVLDCLHDTEPQLHAYVHVAEEAARSAAEVADFSASKGTLHGQCFAVKEVFEVAGIPTSGGCRVLQEHVPKRDATVVRRLREAGAILVGTQVSHELTCGLDEPPTRNPWNNECYPGGSSAGAGVSVAVGSADFALGTDAAGSVRIPAAMTGTVGFKPSAGMVSKQGVLRRASAPSIDNVGIVARTVEAVGAVFDVIAGPDPLDVATLQQVPEGDFGQQDKAVLQGLRFAVLGEQTRQSLDQSWPMDEEIDRAFREACTQLTDAGAEMVTIDLPGLANATPAIVAFFSQELAAAHRDLVDHRALDYHPQVHAMLKQTLESNGEGVADAVRVRSQLRNEISEAFGAAGVELLLTPTTPRVAMPLSTFDPTEELGSLIPYTCGYNLTGQPAISVPCGFTAAGLPIGLQMVGVHYRDAELLRIAQAYEQLNSWFKQQQP